MLHTSIAFGARASLHGIGVGVDNDVCHNGFRLSISLVILDATGPRITRPNQPTYSVATHPSSSAVLMILPMAIPLLLLALHALSAVHTSVPCLAPLLSAHIWKPFLLDCSKPRHCQATGIGKVIYG